MNGFIEDPLWPHFVPLWNELNGVGGSRILMAGGYGLFLKQNWLMRHVEVPAALTQEQWLEIAPRTTRDFDLVLGLDLISDRERNVAVRDILNSQGYSAINPNWKFGKFISEKENVIVELHAPPVDTNRPDLKSDSFRVKRKPSLNDKGIQGRANPETVGSDLHPFIFDVEGIEIACPNPITWAIMKLTAMRDRWSLADDPNQENPDFLRKQAIKHAQDACRIVAMTTRMEQDAIEAVTAEIRGTKEFVQAAMIRAKFFGGPDQRGCQAVSQFWRPDGMQVILRSLTDWFPENTPPK